MCCAIAVLFALGPRAAILVWWLFDQLRWAAAFDTFIWPFLGFLFLPWTTLFYVIAWSPVGGVDGAEWLLVILGVVLDVATYSARAAKARYA